MHKEDTTDIQETNILVLVVANTRHTQTGIVVPSAAAVDVLTVVPQSHHKVLKCLHYQPITPIYM